jgi:hypothetical protein
MLKEYLKEGQVRRIIYVPASNGLTIQGMGAMRAVAAHAAEQVPNAALQARIAGGAAAAAIMVPKVAPAAP